MNNFNGTTGLHRKNNGMPKSFIYKKACIRSNQNKELHSKEDITKVEQVRTLLSEMFPKRKFYVDFNKNSIVIKFKDMCLLKKPKCGFNGLKRLCKKNGVKIEVKDTYDVYFRLITR